MSHTNTAITHLDAIEANLRAVRTRVGARKILAAVKANAYGHGATHVAKMIEERGAADWLGVAMVDEGVELRRAGISLPILKLSHARGADVQLAMENGIVLPVVDVQSVREYSGAAEALGMVAEVHLKVDTGMRRIGCEPEQARMLAEMIVADENLVLTGIFSHMPVSDTPSQDGFSRAQIALFARTAAAVEELTGPITKHLANSGAILAHPDAWFDMVRPGIMLYGAYPDPATPRTVPLVAALTWRAEVSFIKRIHAGETVSYGRTWEAKEDTWIATVPVGYGDGFSRLNSNRGRVLIGGRSYPIAGRVCMDQFMVDLGPTSDVRVGDDAILIGTSESDQITTTEIAQLMGTIPYEVTCGIQSRVERAWE
ncbi:MAG: alanine racemase [Propionibacteriaceae bacterium]|jgi:alanine racemase|nr:alanine racemase [Propionibacteriaceae bacterium]